MVLTIFIQILRQLLNHLLHKKSSTGTKTIETVYAGASASKTVETPRGPGGSSNSSASSLNLLDTPSSPKPLAPLTLNGNGTPRRVPPPPAGPPPPGLLPLTVSALSQPSAPPVLMDQLQLPAESKTGYAQFGVIFFFISN